MMKGIHYAISPYYYGLMGCLVSISFIIQIEATHFGKRFGFWDFFIFFMIGLMSAFGSISKSLAFQYEKVSTLSLIKYTNLFYSLAADVLLFHSHIYFGEIVGASLILGSNFVVAILKLTKMLW